MNSFPNATASASPAAITHFGRLLGEPLVGDIDAAEFLLQLRADAAFAEMLAHADEDEPALAEFAGHITEGRARVWRNRPSNGCRRAAPRCMPTRLRPHTAIAASMASSMSRARFWMVPP